jgi:hypothetical protein
MGPQLIKVVHRLISIIQMDRDQIIEEKEIDYRLGKDVTEVHNRISDGESHKMQIRRLSHRISIKISRRMYIETIIASIIIILYSSYDCKIYDCDGK